jgi:hypothetical protein
MRRSRGVGTVLALFVVLLAPPAARSAPASRAAADTATPKSAAFSTSTGAMFAKDVTISTLPGTRLGNVTDTAEATIAFWLRGTRANGGPGGPDDTNNGSGATASLWQFALFANDRATRCEAGNGAPGAPADGWCIAPLDNSPPGAQYNFNDSLGTGVTHGVDMATINAKKAFTNGRWNFLIATYKKGHCALYNGTTSAITACPNNISSTIVNNLANPHGAFIWNAVESISAFGYLQDFYLSQAYLGCTGRGAPYPDCKADNTIAPSVLARFIRDGRAVDLGADCSGPSGRQPAICLTGDAAAMQVNKGYATGLALRQIGGAPLKPDATLDDSSYGAAGMREHQVTLKNLFFNAAPYQTACAEGVAVCAFAVRGGVASPPNSGGQPLAVGDLRVLVVALSDSNASTDHQGGCPTTASGRWTRLQPASPGWDTNSWLYSYICYVRVSSAKEEDYVSGVSWTSPAEGRSWAMLTYANVAAVRRASAVVSAKPSAVLSTPAVALPAGPSKLVSIWTSAEGAGAGRTYAYAGPGKRQMRPAGWVGPIIYVVDEDVARGGGARRDLARNVATHGGSVNFSLSLTPN